MLLSFREQILELLSKDVSPAWMVEMSDRTNSKFTAGSPRLFPNGDYLNAWEKIDNELQDRHSKFNFFPRRGPVFSVFIERMKREYIPHER